MKKAKIAYPWSSYGNYTGTDSQGLKLVDTSFRLDLAGGKEQLLQFLNADNSDRCLDLENISKLSDEKLIVW